LIPAGVLSFDKSRWIPGRKSFLFKTTSLAKLFRRLYIQKLQTVYEKNELIFPGNIAEIGLNKNFLKLINNLKSKQWIVYAKRPFAGPEKVLEYLGRYTHRVVRSNNRIQSVDNGKVVFSYKDRSDGNKIKNMTVKADEFIRRFLLHVLPHRFMKIRYFGFLFNRERKKNIALILKLINAASSCLKKVKETVAHMVLRLTGIDITLCPKCKKGRMIPVVIIPKRVAPG